MRVTIVWFLERLGPTITAQILPVFVEGGGQMNTKVTKNKETTSSWGWGEKHFDP